MARTKQTARPATLPIVRRVADPDQQRTNQEVSTSLRLLSGHPFAQGRVTDATAIATSSTRVAHKLGRVPLGWFVVSPQADSRVWQAQAPDADYLYLQASSSVTTSLFVF